MVGAAINGAPELYKAIIASVPFMDVVTTTFDESTPLTTGEYDGWGNSNKKEYYEYMLSYSSYDQVHWRACPTIYVSAGLYDL